MSQLSLFDMENTSTKPLPLVVAEQWGFPLQYHQVGEQYWYAVQDWVNGLIGPDVPKATMSGIMGSVQPNLTKMPYRTPKRGTPPRDYAQDVTLYQIAQNLRQTKERKALASILKFLAQSGAFVDALRTNPQEAAQEMEDFAARRARQLGHDETWIAERRKGIVTRNQLTAAIAQCVMNPEKWFYGKLTDTEYLTLLDDDTAGLMRRNGGLAPRDGMHASALNLLSAGENAILSILKERETVTQAEALAIVKQVMEILRPSAIGLSNVMGIDIATRQPLLNNHNT